MFTNHTYKYDSVFKERLITYHINVEGDLQQNKINICRHAKGIASFLNKFADKKNMYQLNMNYTPVYICIRYAVNFIVISFVIIVLNAKTNNKKKKLYINKSIKTQTYCLL